MNVQLVVSVNNKNMGTLSHSFRCVHVHELSSTTICLIREEYNPSYTDSENEEVNHLFRVDGLMEQLEFLRDNEDERSGNYTTNDYQQALNELSTTIGLNEYEYFSMDSAK